MKVLHISTAMTWRGGEQQVVYLYQGLQQKQTEQVLICPQGSALAEYCAKNNMAFRSFKKSGNVFSTLKNIAQIIKEEKPSLLHAHDGKAHTLAYLNNVLSSKPLPLIVHRRVAFAKKNTFFSKLKYNHKSIKAVVCVSEYIAVINRALVKSKEKIEVVYDAVDLGKFEKTDTDFLRKELHIDRGAFVVGNIAAFTAEKDHLTFVETAFKLLKSIPEAKFILIGAGPLKQETELLIREKGLSGNLILTGFLPESHRYLAGFDVLLFPSKIEGLGTTILDAFACAVPVVATRTGGIPEIVIHEETGLLAAVGDSGQLAENIIRLHESAELRKKVTDGTSKLVAGFGIEKMTGKILAIYAASGD